MKYYQDVIEAFEKGAGHSITTFAENDGAMAPLILPGEGVLIEKFDWKPWTWSINDLALVDRNGLRIRKVSGIKMGGLLISNSRGESNGFVQWSVVRGKVIAIGEEVYLR